MDARKGLESSDMKSCPSRQSGGPPLKFADFRSRIDTGLRVQPFPARSRNGGRCSDQGIHSRERMFGNVFPPLPRIADNALEGDAADEEQEDEPEGGQADEKDEGDDEREQDVAEGDQGMGLLLLFPALPARL